MILILISTDIDANTDTDIDTDTNTDIDTDIDTDTNILIINTCTIYYLFLSQIHQLNDESRGPTVEAIVSRMKTVRSSVAGETGGRRLLRFIAISATLPNIDDVNKHSKIKLKQYYCIHL